MDSASTLYLSCSPDPDCGRQWNNQGEVEVGKERKSGLHPSPFCSIPNSLGQSLKSQVYSQLSASLRMGWSHKEGAGRPQAFHPIPTDLSRNILLQSRRNVGLTLLTLVTSSSAAVAVATSPQRPLSAQPSRHKFHPPQTCR